MEALDPKAIVDDWLKRFDLIENDIQEILLRRHVFLRLQEIVAKNPRLHRPSYLYEYLAGTYAVTNAIAVRRHARHDDERRDGSLIGLLYAIRRSPELLTHIRHVALYEEEGMLADLAEKEFDRLAEPGAAHLDREEPSTIPTFDDLNKALDVFEKIVRRYRLLLRAVGFDHIVVPG
jgi:hypothetical protein